MIDGQDNEDGLFSKLQRLAQWDEDRRSRLAQASSESPNSISAEPQLSSSTTSSEFEPDLVRLMRGVELLEQASLQDKAAGDIVALGRDLHQLPARYRLLKRLGQGGFGVVLLARDLHLNRDVALKLPRGNVLLTKSMIQRFLREAQHVAQLDHPNIVKVLGTEDNSSMPMIVYAYCNGPTLSEWLAKRQSPVPIHVALSIMTLIGEAVQHAHRRGIIHRDLKPSNILLESAAPADPCALRDEDDYWIPRVTDFGISKDATQDGHDQTTIGTVMGSAEYMAPEQIQGKGADIGWHTDVYALGVMLFELLSGSNPFSSQDSVVRLSQMRTQLPLVRKYRSEVSRDLEAVVAHCLQPAIDERYATTSALVDDLERAHKGLPVSVRRVSYYYRMVRWARHQPVVSTLSGICLLLSLCAIGLVISYIQQARVNMKDLISANNRLTQANREADISRQSAIEVSAKLADQLYASDMLSAANALRAKDLLGFEEFMNRQQSGELKPAERDVAYDYLSRRGRRNGQLLGQFPSGITRMRFSHDWQYLLLATRDGSLHLLNAATQQLLRRFQANDIALNSCAFSPDDQFVATSGEDGFITIWDRESGEQASRFAVCSAAAFQAEWLNADEMVVACDEPKVRIWNWRAGIAVAELDRHVRSVRSLAVDTERQQIITGGDDNQLYVWDMPSCQLLDQPHGTGARIRDLCIASNRNWVMSCDTDGVVRKHCLYETAIPVSELARARRAVECVAVGKDGRRVAFGTREGIIQCVTINEDGNYNIDDLKRFGEAWLAHQGTITDLAFSKDSNYLYSVGNDGTLFRWPAQQLFTRQLNIVPRLTTEPMGDLVIADDDAGRCLLAANKILWIWDPETDGLERLKMLDHRVEQLVSHASLKHFIVAYANGLIQAVDKQRPYANQWEYQWPGCQSICSIDYCAMRHQLAVAVPQPENHLLLVNPDNGQVIRELPLPTLPRDNAYGLKFSPDGSFLAISIGKNIYRWHLASGQLQMLAGHTDSILAINFSHDSQLMISSSEDRSLLLWELSSNQCIGKLRYHQGEVTSCVFSPDDRSIISADQRGESAIWSTRTKSLSMVFDKFSGPAHVPLQWNRQWLFRKVSRDLIFAEHFDTN